MIHYSMSLFTRPSIHDIVICLWSYFTL